ncbi:MAG: endonuclease III [Candidatus Micrarchaeia archaeon]
MKKENIAQIIKNLRKIYPDKFSGSNVSDDPFQILISTILSHRTRDEKTISASNKLFARYDTAKKLASAKAKDVMKLIKETGFYRTKARRIIKVSKILLGKYGGRVPKKFDELVSLPSVGRKTANIVMLYAFGQRGHIPVDTHVHKVSNRLGLVNTKSPEKTEFELMKIIPKKYWRKLNELFVQHGQQICKAMPKCIICPVKKYCRYFLKMYRNG